MSRAAKNFLEVPSTVEVGFLSSGVIKIKGANGSLEYVVPSGVALFKDGNNLKISPDIGHSDECENTEAMIGTVRALLRNMFEGVAKGYEKKLVLVGVGYKAQVQGNLLNLQVGYSHPVNFEIPHGISVETPGQTEVIIRGIDKQLVGQIAARIRSYRSPEPYKGKGIRYFGENIIEKEGKKK